MSGDLEQRRAGHIYKALQKLYPGLTTFLTHGSSFQLLIAVILSAQCTDERVNLVTPGLFEAYPCAVDLASASLDDVQGLIKSVNYFKTKARHIMATAQCLCDRFDQEVPDQLDLLIQLPGVGRKTANVVLGQVFGIPGITVDTHVKRLVNRMGFSCHSDAVRVEFDLMGVWKKSWWIDYSSMLILHGRKVCMARKPLCGECVLRDWCLRKGV